VIFLAIFLVRKRCALNARTELVGCRHVADFGVSIRHVHIPVAGHAFSREYDPILLYSHVTSLSR
jgi:hypothetical protein